MSQYLAPNSTLNSCYGKGTPRYLAQKYWVQEKQPITSKVDVYNFWIVLLQIVSGRKNLCFSQSAIEGNGNFFPKKAFE